MEMERTSDELRRGADAAVDPEAAAAVGGASKEVAA